MHPKQETEARVMGLRSDIPQQEACDQASTQANQKAYIGRNPEASGLPATIRQKLYDRRSELQQELQRVRNAIGLIENDEGVAKVMEVFAAAKI